MSTTEQCLTPCIRVCKVQEGACIGCGRTLEQIRDWSKMTDRERKYIMEILGYGNH